MRSSRVVLLALAAVLCVLPAAPAVADHVRFTPPPKPVAGLPTAGPHAGPVTPAVGPRVRVRRTVAAGAPVLLPKVTGRVRIVCHGPAMRGALVWLERERDGRTAVRRYDGGREYDFTYRVVRGDVRVARERCP